MRSGPGVCSGAEHVGIMAMKMDRVRNSHIIRIARNLVDNPIRSHIFVR